MCRKRKKKVGYKKVLDYGKNKHNQGHRVGGKAEKWKEEEEEKKKLTRQNDVKSIMGNEDFKEEMIHQFTCCRI